MVRHKTQNIILLFSLLVLLFTLSIIYLAYRINERKERYHDIRDQELFFQGERRSRVHSATAHQLYGHPLHLFQGAWL